MSRRLSFQFDLHKLVEALAYMAGHGNIQDLTKLKAAKLLFFADKAHLVRYGRPIIGDRYVSMDQGPVPSQSLNVMNRVIAPDEVSDPVRAIVNSKVSVSKFMRAHPLFRAKHGAEFTHLSGSDREILDEVIKRYGQMSAGALIKLTHDEHAWRASDAERPAGSSAPMSYEAFFEGESGEGAKAVRKLAEAQQEDRSFLAALVR
jgi:uncharacterized phage-associated protein